MIRRELAKAVSEKLGLPAATVCEVLDTVLEVLMDELLETGRLEWRGFGTFIVRRYPERNIHNPATGEVIRLSARRFVTFKPGRKLRERLKAAERGRLTRLRGKGRSRAKASGGPTREKSPSRGRSR
jgi:integration host factor subunit alpha